MYDLKTQGFSISISPSKHYLIQDYVIGAIPGHTPHYNCTVILAHMTNYITQVDVTCLKCHTNNI